MAEVSKWFDVFLAGGAATAAFTRRVSQTLSYMVRRLRTPPASVKTMDRAMLDAWILRVQFARSAFDDISARRSQLAANPLAEGLASTLLHVAAVDSALAKQRSIEFGTWIEEQLRGGAGGLHAATKESLGTFSNDLRGLKPGVHAAQAIADREIKKWAAPSIWDASSTEADARARFDSSVWPQRMPGIRAPPTISAIRDTSRTFPWKTSTGADGLHPRTIASLSDSALACLGLLHVNAEVVGALPELFRITILFTRWKKSGSYRVCGKLPTFYRVYTRVRLPIIREWERQLLEKRIPPWERSGL